MKHLSMISAESRSCLLLLGVVLALCSNQVSSTTNETDRLALLAFKAGITADPFGVLSSWNNSIGFCQWYGITCGRRHRRVTVLDLGSQGLSGPISPYVGNLTFLREMFLQNNSFNQEIPPQLGQLRRLHILKLNNNSLVGEIPKNMSGCSDVTALWLGNNELTGKIPGELGSMSKLQNFSLVANKLTGYVPPSIGNLSSLRELYLSQNNLGGSIPQVLGLLTKLQAIGFENNILSGTIPSSLLNLSSLAVFEIANNRIQGTLPATIGIKLQNLESFSISQNQLEGPIPPSISNCTKLGVLLLNNNRFSGKVPSLAKLYRLRRLLTGFNQLGSGKPEDLSFICSVTNSTVLEFLAGGYNKFGGVLPKCIGNLSTTLTVFTFRMNQISGEIPKEVGKFINLQYLYMGYNRFSGVIPSNLGMLQNLGGLQLIDNHLEGTIPSSLGNLTKLIELYLGGNKFHGQIPSHLSNCRSLYLLDLSHNNLSGAIPPELLGLSSLTIFLNLSHNHLTGFLPTDVGKLRSLTALDISDNYLEGEIPSSLGDCSVLTSLKMGGNFFHGPIPQSLRSLGGIEELDLSRNNLSGQIPKFFVELCFLKLLNLSYNKFEGMLPSEGVFKNVTGTYVVGNNELCGGLSEFHLPNCISKRSKSKKTTLSISIISGVFGMTLILAFIYLCRLKKKVNDPVPSLIKDPYMNVSYGALLKATNGFSSTNLIGVGSFGSVYKGILEGNETVVAVKVLDLVRCGALKGFIVECEMLKNIKHRNVLKILTVCSGSNYQGNDFKALIYQYMDNGSLEDWLHQNTTSCGNKLLKKLNFIQRIDIAIGVASALDYLHHQCHTPIVHCDLKPSNILLDEKMVAHVGDFGLAKFLLGSSVDTVLDQMSSVGLKGTIGYAPPEYAMGCEVSREGDIYSYGIILLELFTGLSPTDEIFGESLTLHCFVEKALPGRVLEITDRVLLQERESHLDHRGHRRLVLKSDGIFQECLVMVYNIGIACSHSVPGRRMSISRIPNQLQQIRDKLFALGLGGEDEQLTAND